MTHLNRRLFLSGAAGALALPLLDSLGANAAPGGPPQRLILFYNPNGTVKENWFPTEVNSETNFELARIHKPFEKYKDLVTIVRGVHSTVAQDPDNNGGPHQRGIGSLFTGQMLLEGNFADGCGSLAGWADGISIDQAVAKQIGADNLFASLEFGVRANENDVQGRISYAGSGFPLPPVGDPRDVYNRLFFRTEPLDPENPDSRAQSILDTVKDQYRQLDKRVGQEDRVKLQRHLSLVEDMERRLGLLGGQGSSSCETPTEPLKMAIDDEATMPEISRAHLDLLASALACDLTRVASVQYSTGFNRIRYPWVDDQGEGHSLSHSGDSNTEAWEYMTGRAEWHAGEIAYLMDLLAEIPEGDGTVLDNTLIVWGSEVSRGNSHSLNDIPYLLLGNAGGKIRSGQFLEYDSKSNCDLLHAIVAAFGVTQETFGHPDHASGILSGILA